MRWQLQSYDDVSCVGKNEVFGHVRLCVSRKRYLPTYHAGQKVHGGFFVGRFSFLPTNHAQVEIEFCQRKSQCRPRMLLRWQKSFSVNVCCVGRNTFSTHAFRCVGIFAYATSKCMGRNSADSLLPTLATDARKKICSCISKDLSTFFLVGIEQFRGTLGLCIKTILKWKIWSL